ncbi:MAG: alkaline phosphatase family protein [Cyclobacteriaceae bacterium]
MRCRSIAAFTLFCFLPLWDWAQTPQTRNIIIVTLDGFRWQEFYKGADPSIVCRERYVTGEEISHFLHESESGRRRLLLPFIWNQVAHDGQLYGNRDFDNRVNCKNDHLLSYPGYSEMLVGFSHKKVSSNEHVENPHATVLETIQRHASFKNEVAAFATWEAFPYILREARSDIYVNAGSDLAEGNLSGQERLLNKYHTNTGVRSDSLTFQYAMEYMKRERPRVTLVGFDETDQHAHAGRYGEYLEAAHRADKMIGELWEWVQSQPDYRDQTTLLITTDHGRGRGPNNWRVHQLLAAGSRHIWFAVVGPDTPAFGEMKMKSKTYQNQVAKTIAAFLGLPYGNEEPVGEVVQTMIAIPNALAEKPSASTAP